MAQSAHAASSPSEPSREIAHRLVAREIGGETGDAALVAAVERVGGRVVDSLTRWFGPYGALALLTRAVTRAQPLHRSLAPVRVDSTAVPSLSGFSDSAMTNGARATAEGAVVLIAVLADLIGRLIGVDLAVRLLEQSMSGPPIPGGVHQNVTEQ